MSDNMNYNDINQNNPFQGGQYQNGNGTYDALETVKQARERVSKGMTMCIIGAFCLLIPPIGIVLILIGYSKVSSAQKVMKSAYKDAFVREPLLRNFQDVFYEPMQGFSREMVHGFQLCKMGNRFSSEDYIRASYEGVTFEVSDVKVADVDGSDNNTRTTTYFSGRMMVFDFPRKLVSSVMIFSKKFKYRELSHRELKKDAIELESTQFNKEFDVYSPTPHDAFYLITPPFMEKMQMLDSKYHSIAVNMVGNRVMLAFNEPGNDAFDSKTTIGKVDCDAEMAKVQSDIDDIKNFISFMLNDSNFTFQG